MKLFNKIILIIFATLGLISCSQERVESRNSENFKTSLLENDFDISQFNNPISLDGDIKVWQNANDEFIAYTETETHKHIFILQGVNEKIDIPEEFSNITFLDHAFSLTTNAGDVVISRISDKSESKKASNILSKVNTLNNKKVDSKSLDGFGVVHRWISKTDDKSNKINYSYLKRQNSVFKSQNLTARADDDPNEEACDSGGEGSNSCSTTLGSSGCSTSCDAGYYACCINGSEWSPAECKCVEG